MDDRLKRTVTLLLAGGLVLVGFGLLMVVNAWPDAVSYRVDGLNNGMPLSELEAPEQGPELGFAAGGVVAVGGAMASVVGAVAIGVRLGRVDGAGDRG